jgi:hypothetical protein
MENSNKCLYCSLPAKSLEHVLPAAFGEFAGAPNLENRICEACNSKRLGILDEHLARCGPEGFFRKWYGVEGRAHHNNVNPFYRRSAGGGRHEVSAWDPAWGVEVNLEVENGRARQLRELIFIEESSRKMHHLPICEDAKSEALLEAFKKLGVVAPFVARITCDPEERAWVEPLLKQAWPALEFGEGTLGSTVYEGAAGQMQVNSRYFRAFAKVGFHYFLTQFGTYSGHEPMFSRIRQFISEGAAGPVSRVNEFVGIRQHPLLGEMLDPNVRPDGWRAHVVCSEVLPTGCFAHVQMFLTEDWAAPIYTICLASDLGAVIPEAAGHVYCYYPDGLRGRFSGKAEHLLNMRANFTPPPLAPAVISSGE